jgi:hypothetical protein
LWENTPTAIFSQEHTTYFLHEALWGKGFKVNSLGIAHQNPLTVGIAHPTRPKIFQKSNIIPIDIKKKSGIFSNIKSQLNQH